MANYNIPIKPGDGKLSQTSDIFSYQDEAIRRLQELDKEYEDKYRTLVVVPTGGGKTRIAIKYIYENVFKSGGKVLWLGERLLLLDQTYESFSKLATTDLLGDLKKSELKVYEFSSKKEDFVNVDLDNSIDLVVITQQTLRENVYQGDNLEKWLSGEDSLTVIIDEAHHATSEPYRKILRRLEDMKANEKISSLHVIGLTATPKATNKDKDNKIEEIFTHGVLVEKNKEGEEYKADTNTSYAYRISIHDLVAKGVLSEPFLVHIDAVHKKKDYTEINNQIVSVYAGGTSKLKYSGGIVNKHRKKKGEKKGSERDKRLDLESFGQTIIFAESREQALLLEEEFVKRNIPCGLAISIDDTVIEKCFGEKEKDKRTREKIAQVKKNIQDYKDGNLPLIISVDMLREGIDVPKTQSVFIAKDSPGEIEVTQMVGRGLRGKNQGGTPFAYIVEFGDNKLENILWEAPDLKSKQDGIEGESEGERERECDEESDWLANLEVRRKLEEVDFTELNHALTNEDIEKILGRSNVSQEEKEKILQLSGLVYYHSIQHVPCGYYHLNRRYLLVWEKTRNWIKNIRDAVKDISMEEFDDRCLESIEKFKEVWEDDLETKSAFKQLYEKLKDEKRIFKRIFWQYAYNLLCEYRANDYKPNRLEKLEYKPFTVNRKYDISKILRQGIKWKDENDISEKLSDIWERKYNRYKNIWGTEDNFKNYITPKIQRLKKLKIVPNMKESSGYFRVKLHRDGRKRENLCKLIEIMTKGGMMELGKIDCDFYDVFGGTGTVTANMKETIKGTRYYNEYDGVVANFVYLSSKSNLVRDYGKFFAEIDKMFKETCMTFKTVSDIADELDNLQEYIGNEGCKELSEECKVKFVENIKAILEESNEDDSITKKKNNVVDNTIEVLESWEEIEQIQKEEGHVLIQDLEEYEYLKTRYKGLYILRELLEDKRIKEYVKIYLALYHQFSIDLYQEPIMDFESWKDSLNTNTDVTRVYKDEKKYRLAKEAAFKYFFLNSFSSRQVSTTHDTGVDPKGILSFIRTQEEEKNWLDEFHNKMKDVVITSKDFSGILETNDKNAIYYLDPPYFLTKQYDEKFGDEKHLKMLEWCRTTDCKWIFSCKSDVTNESLSISNLSQKKGRINRMKGDKVSLEEYFRFFIYPKKEGSEPIVADRSKKPYENKLYVYYPKELVEEKYEIMITNIKPNENDKDLLESYGFEYEEFIKFFAGRGLTI